jgi:hypothetical protein
MGPSDPTKVLLTEFWDVAGNTFRVVVWAPEPHGVDFACWWQVEGLDPAPRRHLQVSAALAVSNAVGVAARDLFAVGAKPRVGTP